MTSILRELGLIIPVGAKEGVPHAWAYIEDEASGIPEALRPVLANLCDEIRALGDRVDAAERQLEAVVKQSPAAAGLRTIPGVGLLVRQIHVPPRQYRILGPSAAGLSTAGTVVRALMAGGGER
jgi:transposase